MKFNIFFFRFYLKRFSDFVLRKPLSLLNFFRFFPHFPPSINRKIFHKIKTYNMVFYKIDSITYKTQNPPAKFLFRNKN